MAPRISLALALHNEFVLWAFRAFFGAALFDAAAVFLTPRVPQRFAWVFVGFAIALAIYVGLLVFGPGLTTVEGAFAHRSAKKSSCISRSTPSSFKRSACARTTRMKGR